MASEDAKEYDKRKFRGIVYIFLGFIGVGYELFFSDSVRSLVIIGYGVVILLGIFYFTFFRSRSQNLQNSN